MKLTVLSESSYMIETVTPPGRGLAAMVGNVGSDSVGLRGGATPTEVAKLGRKSTGGIVGAVTESVTVRNVLVDVWLILRFNGLLRKAVCGMCASNALMNDYIVDGDGSTHPRRLV